MPVNLVFDINVYVSFYLSDSTMVLEPIPPRTGNDDADALSIVYNFKNQFKVFTSYHIRNELRKALIKNEAISTEVEDYIALIEEVIVPESDGEILEALQTTNRVRDHEDNHILYLVDEIVETHPTDKPVLVVTNNLRDFQELKNQNYNKAYFMDSKNFVTQWLNRRSNLL